MTNKRGRPATGNSYPAALSVMVTDEMHDRVTEMAMEQNRSTAFVIRGLLAQALSSSRQSGCGSACTCGTGHGAAD